MTALVLRNSRLSDCTAHTTDLEDEENNVPAVLLLVGLMGEGKTNAGGNKGTLLAKLEVGAKMQGTVKAVTNYGAVLDLGAATDARRPVSRRSDGRSSCRSGPSDALKAQAAGASNVASPAALHSATSAAYTCVNVGDAICALSSERTSSARPRIQAFARACRSAADALMFFYNALSVAVHHAYHFVVVVTLDAVSVRVGERAFVS